MCVCVFFLGGGGGGGGGGSTNSAVPPFSLLCRPCVYITFLKRKFAYLILRRNITHNVYGFIRTDMTCIA